jgi:hypothetical protein
MGYRGLNSHTKPDREPMPRMDDVVDHLQGSKVLSKLDVLALNINVLMMLMQTHGTH